MLKEKGVEKDPDHWCPCSNCPYNFFSSLPTICSNSTWTLNRPRSFNHSVSWIYCRQCVSNAEPSTSSAFVVFLSDKCMSNTNIRWQKVICWLLVILSNTYRTVLQTHCWTLKIAWLMIWVIWVRGAEEYTPSIISFNGHHHFRVKLRINSVCLWCVHERMDIWLKWLKWGFNMIFIFYMLVSYWAIKKHILLIVSVS